MPHAGTDRAAATAALLAGLLLAACQQLPRQPAMAWPTGVPPRVELDGVAFHPQEDYQCGPAALASAFSAAGHAASPATLADQVFLPARRGAWQAEMLAATRRAGLVPYRLAPNLSALVAELAAGRPVVVLQDVGWAWTTQWHYAVAVGYDLGAETLVLRSGREPRLQLNLEDFDATWRPAGRWAFVALPPDRLPVEADEIPYLRAVADLEAVRADAAEVAYRAALARWPESLVARLGLGNAAYARGRLADAEVAFRAATDRHPQAADAWNNLAQVLHETGRGDEAEAAALRAVELGGPRHGTYAATLAEIRRQPAPQRKKRRRNRRLD